MPNRDEALNRSYMGHGVGIKPAFGAHESRQLKVEDENLILETVFDRIAFTMTSGKRPKHLSMTQAEGLNGINTVTYKTPDDALSAEKIVKAESLK